MQTKNKIVSFINYFFIFFAICLNVNANELNISAKEVTIDKKNNTVLAIGDVEAIDSEGRIINSNKAFYQKSIEHFLAEGDVQITDAEGNIITSDKTVYDQAKEMIITYENSELILADGYKLKSNKIVYSIKNKIMSSDHKSTFTDIDGNTAIVDMFQYQQEKNLLYSVGNIKVIDIKKNKYFFKELYVDTKKHEMIGSDVSVLFDQENFGLDEKSDPRFVANDILMTKNKSSISKGVFTVCAKKEEQCPPWSLQAKKISHDKTKKTIHYKNALLKFYNIPIFYFPIFYHPDPTVKRKSGLLVPFFTDSTSVGTGFGLPYYWAISNDKDITFTPKIYAKENILFLNEYRQAFRNAFLILDTSYTEGYKNISGTKTDGSRNHIFANLNINLGADETYNSSLNIKVQRTSNDTFFRVHDINTSLVNSENTDLTNEIKYTFAKNNTYIDISGAVYENLRSDTNDRYEYAMPNVVYGKTFFTDNFGSLDFKSNALYKNYDTNKHLSTFTNDIIWSPFSSITQNGFVNTIKGIFKNTNYEAKNTTDYKTNGTINEFSGVLSFKSSLPMKKDSVRHANLFSPNFMIRYAPGHMQNLTGDDVNLKYSNLYSTNKTKLIEDGLSAILGFDFSINEKNEKGDIGKEKLSISMGQVFSNEENDDMPSKSSLDQKTSDVVGEINYNFSEMGKINYKFSVDHNLNDINYNEISTSLNFSKFDFNLDYLEEQNHVGNEHYVKSGISLNFNEHNKLSFNTKKNFKTESTELYDVGYQYMIDCLTAGLYYRREFYEDSDIEEKDTLMFKITFVPFTGVKTPSLK